MEIRLAVNALPFLALLSFLASLKIDPGHLLFGDEKYDGELALWGVIFRTFCVAAFFRFRVLWPVLAYVCAYALLGQFYGRALETLVLGALGYFASNYRETLIDDFSMTPPKINLPKLNLSSIMTPFSGQSKRTVAVNGFSQSKGRSQSPPRRRVQTEDVPDGRSLNVRFQDESTPDRTSRISKSTGKSKASSSSGKQSVASTKSPILVLGTPKSVTAASATKTGPSSALEEAKRLKRQEQDMRTAARATRSTRSAKSS